MAASASAASAPEADGFGSLSVPELKDLLDDRGVDHSGAIEKGDLVRLVRTGADGQMTFARAIAPGQFHNIQQTSPEWFHIRRGEYGVRLGGSEVGFAVGVSPWTKPFQLYDEIVAKEEGTWVSDPDDDKSALNHGNDCEPLIAGMYDYYVLGDGRVPEKDKNDIDEGAPPKPLPPRQFTLSEGGYYQHSDEYLGELYGASPDRRIMSKATGKVEHLLEIKAPYGRMHVCVKPEYMAQMQYQMWCSGLDQCDFLVIKLDQQLPEKTIPSKIRVFYAHVPRSEAYIKWMLPRIFYFSRCLILRQRPARDLYENEMTGFDPPPHVDVEEVIVPNGAWRLQGEA